MVPQWWSMCRTSLDLAFLLRTKWYPTAVCLLENSERREATVSWQLKMASGELLNGTRRTHASPLAVCPRKQRQLVPRVEFRCLQSDYPAHAEAEGEHKWIFLTWVLFQITLTPNLTQRKLLISRSSLCFEDQRGKEEKRKRCPWWKPSRSLKYLDE